MESFKLCRAIRLSALPPKVGIPPENDADILAISSFGYPDTGGLTFCDRPVSESSATLALRSIVLTNETSQTVLRALFPEAKIVVTSDPRASFIDALSLLTQDRLLGHSSSLPDKMFVSPEASISDRAIVEDGVRIDAGAEVRAGAIVRKGSWLQSGSVLGENSVVGSEGIHLYIGKDGLRRSFPHLGSVIIERGARVGVGCVIPKGILNTTRIGQATIIGNLCNIGHGAQIGANVWISSGTMIGGQTIIEEGATIALGCALRDNITIGNNATLGMGSVVTKNVRAGCSVFGNPAKIFQAINGGPTR